MSIRCAIGIHAWRGCRCGRCGRIRKAQHAWDGCRCASCGATRAQQHRWSGCRCTGCGAVREQGHEWTGCRCATCGQVRDEGHAFGHDGRCRTCGSGSCSHARCDSWPEGTCAFCGADELRKRCRSCGREWNAHVCG